MQDKSLLGSSLIWFGAGVSIAEIVTGMLLAPLGLWKALAAILLGHAIGAVLLYFAGVIGARCSVTAMEGVKRSFGSRGGLLFATLNLIQLAGWTAVMIAAGAQSSQGLLPLPHWAWSAIIGGLILAWISFRARELKFVNIAAVTLLFLLSVLLSITIFRHQTPLAPAAEGALTFGEALELSVAMPLSWLPLIADYTNGNSRPRLVSFLSALIYFISSSWMYFIGLAAALFAGGEEITAIMSKAGLGVPALLIVIFSTVTTTYLDVYSSEMSLQSITQKIPAPVTGIAVSVIGTLTAIFCSTGAFENFLYYIGSVFAPMIAVQIVDFFLLTPPDGEGAKWKLAPLGCWLAGFVLYRALLVFNPCFGSTIPVMLFTMVLYYGTAKLQAAKV